jgi:uncharacterized protein YqgQ
LESASVSKGEIVEIQVILNLDAFSEDKLKELFKDGVITRHEYLRELNLREDRRVNREIDKLNLKRLLDGQQSR